MSSGANDSEDPGGGSSTNGGGNSDHLVIQCLYCSAEIFFIGIPAKRYEEHLSKCLNNDILYQWFPLTIIYIFSGTHFSRNCNPRKCVFLNLNILVVGNSKFVLRFQSRNTTYCLRKQMLFRGLWPKLKWSQMKAGIII